MDIPLGKPTPAPERYDPGVLAPMARAAGRRGMGLDEAWPFAGEDLWRGYEFSWLSQRGMPQVALVELRVSARSPNIVESKSMKLYFNSFAQTRFDSEQVVAECLRADLQSAFGAPVAVTLKDLEAAAEASLLPGASLDSLDIDVDTYERAPHLLSVVSGGSALAETVYTHRFRSLCPVTGQPDWASLLIRYQGPALDHAGLLRYLVSFRCHQAFHETTVEQIFLDLKSHGHCERLLVAGYFLRRGGVDINPVRGDPGMVEDWPVLRLARQ
ncbi:MAG: NADPH-dependent 7-cyano-7-deazaguanine reductase QueF [Gammaproteobacteria bacterium]|nr:NADPH-dependent 7-cyano-7-deazaguanine reductase QueF [Gammaproteobacteria bacterium]